jgi:hypothetical protein
MVPTSRGRKGKGKTTSRRMPPSPLTDRQQACDCPACAGDVNELDQLAGGLVETGQLLLDAEDPINAEFAGATFAALDGLTGGAFEPTFVDQMLPRLESAADAEALAILLAVGSVAPGRMGTAAKTVAQRLTAAGVPRPRWADELGAPVTGGDFHRLHDTGETVSVLGCSFHRAGRAHLFIVNVDPEDCGAANDVVAVPGGDLFDAFAQIRNAAGEDGVELRTEQLAPEEFRWQVENALNARAVHDEGDLAVGLPDGIPEQLFQPDGDDGDDEDDGPATALLLRKRLATLPAPTKPPAPHSPDCDDDGALTAVLSQLVNRKSQQLDPMASLFGLGGPSAPATRGASRAPLPAKRKRSAGPAPIYQIKVSLRGAKPPIWRRLEMPANISLARLHAVIQIAFGWENSHLHVFETPYGQFGTPDEDLDHRAEKPVSLEQVLAEVKTRISYTYDFGDGWEHEIVLEKILERDPAAQYPRCTGGRRAGPPEDCGGIWGYAELVEVLGEPGHPEHDERLEWLGLRDASEFDPAEFDAQDVNKALSTIR